MTRKEFNLIHQRWIWVIDHSGRVGLASLRECFQRAHEIKAFASELATLDMATLRFMLAIMYAALARDFFRKGGDREDALDLWESFWKQGHFPIDKLDRYFEEWRDRFDLYHPDRPFYQVPDVKGTFYIAAKLLGDVSDSNNKARLFGARSGVAKESLDDDEAARWLIHLQAYDDSSSKPSTRGGERLPKVGPGWVGQLGGVYVEGGNLFETLMLNWVLFDPVNMEVYPDAMASWEAPNLRSVEQTIISHPSSPVALLTLQSRRVFLNRDPKDDRVIGFTEVKGDGLDPENVFIENMTLWKEFEKGKTAWVHVPKTLPPEIQIWREFGALALKDTVGHLRPPGVVIWQSLLDVPRRDLVRVRYVGMEYDSKKCSTVEVLSDAIEMHGELLDRLADNEWLPRIVDCLELTTKVVKAFSVMARDLVRAAGGSGDRERNHSANDARTIAYATLDRPFRSWLAGINPVADDMDQKVVEWRNVLRVILLELAKQRVKEAGGQAMVGVIDKDERKKEGTPCNAFVALLRFEGNLKKLLGESPKSNTGGASA